MIETSVPQKLNMWFNNCPVLAIHKLQRSMKTNDNKSSFRYLVLMSRKLPLPQVNTDILRKVVTLQQSFVRGITADTILLMMMKQLKQCRIDDDHITRNPDATSRLLITKFDFDTSKKGYQVALEVQLKAHVLNLISRTFIATDKKMGYFISKDCLKWSSIKTTQVYSEGGLSGQQNVTDFWSLIALDKFNKTKLGIMNELVTELGKRYSDCFKIVPTFHFSEVTSYIDKVKIPTKSNLVLLLKNQQINFMGNPKRPETIALSNYLKERMAQSPALNSVGVSVSSSTKLKTGLNIQVLLDLKDTSYLCGEADKVIQHITVEKFVHVASVSQSSPWDFKKGDIIDDPKFQMTLYQLLIKRDIQMGKLQVPTENEISTSSACRYFYFENLARNQVKIKVTRLIINQTGKLIFDTRTFCGNDDVANDELLRVAKQAWEANGKKFHDLLGAFFYQGKLFAILKSELITIPQATKIKQLMTLSSGENIVKRSNLLAVAESLPVEGVKQNEHKNKLIMDLRAITKETLPVNKLNEHLIELTWRLALMKKFNENFYQYHKKWLYLPVRQQIYNAYWMGTHGMGLAELKGSCYYFVGQIQSLKQTQARAIPFKKILAVDSERPSEDIRHVFELFQPMLQVGFVRMNQYTVIPFPFKYIREYVDMTDHKLKDNQ